jgi:glycosyltransferase involved in cell wall biosynthesis
MPTFTYSIVVCTKNRPKEFEAFLKNFNSGLTESLTEVIVVDGLDPELLLVNQNLGKNQFPNQNLWKSIVTNKGKPSALNKAMEHLRLKVESDDAVVFLDDDIYFTLECLETAIDYLLAHEICGLSPLIINEDEKCPKNRKEAKQIKLKRNAGRLNAFGENYWINQLDSASRMDKN